METHPYDLSHTGRRTAVGSGYDVAVAAGLRRLGGWLVQHGQRDAGKDVLRQAFVLDPEPMRRGATASIDSGGAGGGAKQEL